MEKIRVMELLLHCADISNCVKPWGIHTKFTGQLLEEFFKQVRSIVLHTVVISKVKGCDLLVILFARRAKDSLFMIISD